MSEVAFEDDKLERKAIAENFKSILLNTDLNVISVSAPWGGGKTYFIQNLIKLMENDSINILYNAWESDFYESPLIPLFVELFNELEKVDIKTKLEKDIKWSKKFAKNICKKSSFQVGVNLGVVNCAANFDPNKKMIKSEYIELKGEMQEFKRKLTSIQTKLNKKIIIFVYELDRCYPMYTIKTLEIIKHFFGIPNIIFVLSVDKKQVENSVRQIFGVNIGEENGYLRKFIDVDFQLPTPSMEQLAYYNLTQLWDKINKFIEDGRYYNYKLQRHIDSFGFKRNMDINNEQIYLSSLISEIAEVLNFSARYIVKFFARLDLTLDILSEKDVLFIEPVILFNLLALIDIDEINNYTNLHSSTLIDKLNQILPIWRGIFFKSYKTEIENFYKQGSASNNTTRDNAIKINSFLEKAISRELNLQELYIQDYPEKIKFIHNFNTME